MQMTTTTTITNPQPTGSTSLPHLLRTLSPTLHPSTFIFLTFPTTPTPDNPNPHAPPPATLLSTAQMTFREPEGLTLITTPALAASHNVAPSAMSFRSRMITCDVHSSLSAVGFLAAITGRLKDVGVAVNPVSGFFHDHLFVEEGREAEAMGALRGLVEEAREGRGQGEEEGREGV